MKNLLFLIILLIIQNIYAQNDTLTVYYDIGKYKLSKKNIHKINSKFKTLDKKSKYHIQIISSCDYLGSNKNNLILSSKRAETVRQLLLDKENIIVSSIKYKGIGEMESKIKTSNGIKKHRKTVIIIKTETQFILENLASSNKGDVFILKNIIFDPGRHLLKPKSIPILKQLLQTLKDNPKLKIEISGHVCCGKSPLDSLDGFDKDTKTYNLSETRAKHIYNYLVLKNIDSTRLAYRGYGFLYPLYFPEKSRDDKSNNRRVEIKIISN